MSEEKEVTKKIREGYSLGVKGKVFKGGDIVTIPEKAFNERHWIFEDVPQDDAVRDEALPNVETETEAPEEQKGEDKVDESPKTEDKAMSAGKNRAILKRQKSKG